jgi:hypothetical protein
MLKHRLRRNIWPRMQQMDPKSCVRTFAVLNAANKRRSAMHPWARVIKWFRPSQTAGHPAAIGICLCMSPAGHISFLVCCCTKRSPNIRPGTIDALCPNLKINNWRWAALQVVRRHLHVHGDLPTFSPQQRASLPKIAHAFFLSCTPVSPEDGFHARAIRSAPCAVCYSQRAASAVSA